MPAAASALGVSPAATSDPWLSSWTPCCEKEVATPAKDSKAKLGGHATLFKACEDEEGGDDSKACEDEDPKLGGQAVLSEGVGLGGCEEP